MILNKIKGFHLELGVKNLCSSCQYSRTAIDRYKSSKLLRDYFKLGRIRDAENLFDEIPEKNVVAWSIMIYGYAKHGFRRRSLESFSCMRVLGLVPNSFTIVGVLVGIVGTCDLVLARTIHGFIIKIGLESDLIVGTSMLDAFAKCGNIFDSSRIFKQMICPSLVSCNAMLAGFVQNELFNETILLFNQLQKYGLMPNSVTVLTLIRGCVPLESRGLCKSIHCLVVKSGLVLETSVSNSVLDMYSSLNDLDAATKIFNDMECKDVVSWTTMIDLLVHLENAVDALRLFWRMRKNGVDYDAVVIMSLISACAVLGDIGRGRQIHAQVVIHGFGLELPLANSLISMYSKCGDLDCSKIVFNSTASKSLVSWTAMISGCVQNGRPRQALELLIRMRAEETFGPDSMMLASSLTVSGELAALELCQQLQCYALETGFSQYGLVRNSLISAYSKCGNVELAHNVFKEMGYLRDVVSWNALITGYGINGRGKTAVALFHEMKKNGARPNAATYMCILSACSHSGLVDDGLTIFNQMVQDNEIKPSHEHYGCVVDLLARAGNLSEASCFMRRFWEGMGLNGWRALLGGCLLHGNTRLAEEVARRIFEQDPQEPDQIVLLSNVYASAGRYQDAEAMRLNLEKVYIKNSGPALSLGFRMMLGDGC
ncbi:Pentatricopeptide repeat-containing protein [Actinidia chinensis var. chinensis]|uniref:Pentatricopeptide repeat-containing protein n=1 Tax=Actinidia chinensis var. chinensis TaxID=1590841 RepID=A0A2R6RHM7_ACTCC|nr:Pentatricopeptide repeat-containing protein [Actinidia chinensis var. chinensis]